MRQTPYYLTIFHQIVQDIYTGTLQVGDSLDSMKTMCEKYAAGANTIHTVIKKLAESGFIATARGKPPVVISDCGSSQYCAGQLCRSIGRIADCYEMICLVVPSIAVCGAKRFDARDCEQLRALIAQMQERVSVASDFRALKKAAVLKLLSRMDNARMMQICRVVDAAVLLPRMASDMMAQAEVFLRELRLYDIGQMEKIADEIEAGRFDCVKRDIQALYRQEQEAVAAMLRSIGAQEQAKADTEEEMGLPGGYLYDHVAADLLNQIYSGDCARGAFLPAESTLCARYHVSIATVRRALKILNEMDVVKTINGKGTQVTLFSETAGTEAALRRAAELAGYLESLDLICTTVQDVAVCAARRISRAEARDLEQRLRMAWQAHSGQVRSATFLLAEVVKATKCTALQEHFMEIGKDLIWEYYLEARLPGGAAEMLERRHYQCLEAVEELKCGRAQRFGACMEALFGDMARDARQQMQALGVFCFFPQPPNCQRAAAGAKIYKTGGIYDENCSYV